MIIGIDCDEILAETLDVLLQTSSFLKEHHITRNDISAYNPLQSPKIKIPLEVSIKDFFGLFASEKYWSIQPVQGAKEILQQRKSQGNELIVITGRPLEFQERTKSRVNQHYPNLFSDFLFAGSYTDQEINKSELCKQRGIQCVVEDNLFFVNDLSQHNIPCFLIDKPRNQEYTSSNYPGVIKVSSRNEIDLSLFPTIHE